MRNISYLIGKCPEIGPPINMGEEVNRYIDEVYKNGIQWGGSTEAVDPSNDIEKEKVYKFSSSVKG